MSDAAALLEAVLELARVTGETARAHFGAGLAVETKSDGSPVTRADRDAERAAREWLERRFPQDGVLGEEWGEVRQGAKRRWILDPVDGTKSFVRGVPLWASLAAVCEGERVLAGAAVFPALGESVAAARGAGAWWNGTRCAVSEVSALSSAMVLTTDESFAASPAKRPGWERLAAAAGARRTWGDAYGYLLVATGRAEAMLDGRAEAWDLAPFAVIVEEAGGTLTDWSGRATPFGGDGIATNAALERAVREAVRT